MQDTLYSWLFTEDFEYEVKLHRTLEKDDHLVPNRELTRCLTVSPSITLELSLPVPSAISPHPGGPTHRAELTAPFILSSTHHVPCPCPPPPHQYNHQFGRMLPLQAYHQLLSTCAWHAAGTQRPPLKGRRMNAPYSVCALLLRP